MLIPKESLHMARRCSTAASESLNFASGPRRHPLGATHFEIGGEALKERIWLTYKVCFCCPTSCGKYSRTRVGEKSDYVEGPE